MTTVAMKQFQAVKGMNDLLPMQTVLWQHLEQVLVDTVIRYGYQQIRTPVLEQTALFERTIGQGTDIVEKEMYSFDDNGEDLTLRPEGTAGCVRAAIEHRLLHNQTQRLWYMGPMFRHEKPQHGRYRQFYQFGIEAIGMKGPDIDAEQILMVHRVWRTLGLANQITLQLNSLGSSSSRAIYREQLTAYFRQHFSELDADSQRRLTINPLRILDSKNPQMQHLIQQAPKLLDYIEPAAKEHFEGLRRLLDAAQISYEINPRLVRGLDYYGLTVYEWVANTGGTQNTVCAGGRYDSLVEQLGWESTPAVGFAMGLERVLGLMAENQTLPHLDAYFILVGDEAARQGLLIAEQLRDALPHLKLLTHCEGGSFKSQFKRADKSQAQWALIIGDNELQENKIAIKNLREKSEQQLLTLDEVIHFLKTL